jgi:hypothetical protein
MAWWRCPLAEQSAQVIRTSAAANNGTSIVDAVAASVDAYVGGRWTLDESTAGKALFSCIATGAEIVLHGTANQLRVGFAPDGGVSDWAGTPTANLWTGMCNITGATNNILTSGDGTVLIAEYPDAIAIILGGVNRWTFGAMAGRVLTPCDESDRAFDIGVDALFSGAASNLTADGNWLSGSWSAARVNAASVARVGGGFRPVFAARNLYAAPNTHLDRIDEVERFVPYIAHVKLPNGAAGGMLGATKYLRQWRAQLPHETRLFSDTPGSDQAWIGWSTDATGAGGATHNQVVLWAKTETVA